MFTNIKVYRKLKNAEKYEKAGAFWTYLGFNGRDNLERL